MQLTEQEKQQLTKIRQAKLEILFTSRDSDGNFLVFNKGQLYLRQESEDRNRRIGDIYYVNDTLLYMKWEKEKDVFQKMDAWSIPLLVAKNVDVINFKTPINQYWITHDIIKELLRIKQASILKFEDMEKKVYIPRKFWKNNPIDSMEEHDFTLLAHNPVKEKPNMEKYINRVGESWAKVLTPYFETPYMKSIGAKLAEARQKGKVIYPESKDVFRAFRMTPYDKVKVIVLSQDPYHDGNSTGLAFECKNKVTPSMHRIIEGYNEQFPNNFSTDILDGKLDRWAEEGVLLLNAALTVRRGEAGSHLKQWSPFTQEVLVALNKRPSPPVFLLWGKMALQYRPLLNNCRGLVTEHPVAGAYDKGRPWNHNNCFIKANELLKGLGIEEITW